MSSAKVWIITLVRVLFGVIFLVHGIAKFQMGLDNVSNFFQSMGFPAFLAYIVACCELIGGIALILGFGTRFVSLVFFVIMLGAIFKVKLQAGLLGNGKSPGFELELALALISLYFAADSNRSFSIDSLLSKARNKPTLNS